MGGLGEGFRGWGLPDFELCTPKGEWVFLVSAPRSGARGAGGGVGPESSEVKLQTWGQILQYRKSKDPLPRKTQNHICTKGEQLQRAHGSLEGR